MELPDAIRNRRSIRRYKSKSVSEQNIREILESGMEAPSAGNLQGRYFFAVRDQKLRNGLASAAFGQDFIAEAPVDLVVCADLRIQKEYGSRGTELYSIMDCAASIQNMMLLAHSLGLGTCWVGAFDEKQVVEILSIPPHLRPVAIVSLGFAAERPSRPSRVRFELASEFR